MIKERDSVGEGKYQTKYVKIRTKRKLFNMV